MSSFFMKVKINDYALQFGSIVNVGANIGQFAISTRRFYPETKIYSFEQVPKAFENLKKTLRSLRILPYIIMH